MSRYGNYRQIGNAYWHLPLSLQVNHEHSVSPQGQAVQLHEVRHAWQLTGAGPRASHHRAGCASVRAEPVRVMGFTSSIS